MLSVSYFGETNISKQFFHLLSTIPFPHKDEAQTVFERGG